jgi:alkylated DNA repair dioxygenase AlkB
VRPIARARTAAEPPAGLVYRPELVGADEERALLAALDEIAFHEVRMRGQVARRTVRHFGLDYDYESYRLTPAEPPPPAIEPVRARCAALAGRESAELAQILVSRYPPGATIGWHRDAPMFGDVVGVSLGAPCRMRLQRGTGDERRVYELVLEPRSAYVLAGEARTAWQHSIPAVAELRFSITFRTLRNPARWLGTAPRM